MALTWVKPRLLEDNRTSPTSMMVAIQSFSAYPRCNPLLFLLVDSMDKRELVIIGGGGHTRVLLAMAQTAGLSVRGIITSSRELVGTTVFDVPVLGLENEVALNAAEVTLVNGVGNIASQNGSGMAPRKALYERYRARGFDFLPLISTQAMVQPHVVVGHGTQIMAGAVVQPGGNLGENVIINTRASIDHDATIGAHCHIAPGAVLCGHVTIGEATHIGAGAIIIQKVTIGREVVIGAGAVITHNVPDGAVIRAK